MTFLKPGLNSIHDIKVSYVTSNTYILTFLIPGVNTFVMTGVNSIYELIRYNKSLVFWLIYLNHFSYQIYSLVANCEANSYYYFITFWLSHVNWLVCFHWQDHQPQETTKSKIGSNSSLRYCRKDTRAYEYHQEICAVRLNNKIHYNT